MTVLFCVSFQVTHSRAENNVQLYWIKANHTHVCGREKNIRGGYILGYIKSVRILFHSTFLSVTAKTSTFVFFWRLCSHIVTVSYVLSEARTHKGKARARPSLPPPLSFILSRFPFHLTSLPWGAFFLPNTRTLQSLRLQFSRSQPCCYSVSCKLEWGSQRAILILMPVETLGLPVCKRMQEKLSICCNAIT